jgi:hypothetical protein
MAADADVWDGGTLTYDGQNYEIVDRPYWEGDCFHVPTRENGVMAFAKAYLSSIEIEGLRFDFENQTLVGNNKTWSA